MAWNVSEGCHLKEDYWKVITRGGILLPDTCDCMSCHRQDNTGAVVWRCRHRPPPSLCTDSLFRKQEGEKITDQRRTNSLTSSSCLSTFKTSCVFSSEREMKKKKKQRHIDQPTEEELFMTTTELPRNGGREGERERETERKQCSEDTFEDIFTHSLYTTRPYLMSLSYWRLPGLCWFLLRSGETPRAGSKGGKVSALLACQAYESHSD